MTPATVLDTELFAPSPRPLRAVAAQSRPGTTVVETPTSLVRARDTGPAEGAGGPTVVLLTDAPHVVEHYDDVVAALAPAARVVVVEPPGFGFSWATDPAALTFEGSVAALVDTLATLGVPDDAVLGGACVYGLLAVGLAATRPSARLLLSQTPSFEAGRHWGTRVLDPGGALAVPWEGQVAWRAFREQLAVDSWYGFAAGPDAPLDRWRATARAALAGGASYALASQGQTWWGEAADVQPPVADVPAVLLWGEADRSHRKAGTDPEGLSAHVPAVEVRRVAGAGHFVDTEAPERVREALASLG